MFTRRRIATLPLAFLVARADAAFATPNNTVPLDLSGQRPAVSVSLAGGPGELWVFDTGAGGVLINLDRAQALGFPEQQHVNIGSPAGGAPMQGYLTTIPELRAGDSTLTNVRAVAAPPILPDRSGVLSPNAFVGRLVIVDLAASQLRIQDRGASAVGAVPYLGEGHGAHALPAIPVRVGEQSFMAHMDSGNPRGLTFPYAMAASLPLASTPVANGQAHFVDGAHTLYSARITGEVQIGPVRVSDPDIGLIEGLPYVNVGASLLRRLIITLDPERQISWTEASGA